MIHTVVCPPLRIRDICPRVAAAVHAASPSTPVILLTGWGHRLLAENEVPPEVNWVLSKPPKLAELRTALAELTNAPRSQES